MRRALALIAGLAALAGAAAIASQRRFDPDLRQTRLDDAVSPPAPNSRVRASPTASGAPTMPAP